MPNTNVPLFSAMPAWADRADPILDMCLEYISCMASVSYYEVTSQTQGKALCDDMYPQFLQIVNETESNVEKLFSDAGWNIGEAYKFDLEYGGAGQPDMTPAEWEEFSTESAVAYTVQACHNTYGTKGKTLSPLETEYYDVAMVKNDASKKLYMTALLKTCPDGGLGVPENPITIKTCHVDTFADITGNGVYQDSCYYTTD